MQDVGEQLALRGYVLRSGGAEGADVAFEKGCDRIDGAKKIFYTRNWKERAGAFSLTQTKDYTFGQWENAEKIASQHHPYWSSLKPYTRKLMTRNSFQVVGENLKQPAEFLLCWTPDAAVSKTSKETGGTGQAIRIASSLGIKVYNFANPEHLELATSWLDKQ